MTSSSSESILLLVPHVKLKKNEGELYLMSERLGWMVGNKDSFNVTHKYSDIKSKSSFLQFFLETSIMPVFFSSKDFSRREA